MGRMPPLPDWLRYTNFCKRFPAVKPWEVTPKPGAPPPAWWIGKSEVLDEAERLIHEHHEQQAKRRAAKRQQ